MCSCYLCETSLREQDVSMAMNLPDVTPGPIHFCYDCRPVPDDPQEIIDSIDSFINPPKERGTDG